MASKNPITLNRFSGSCGFIAFYQDYFLTFNVFLDLMVINRLFFHLHNAVSSNKIFLQDFADDASSFSAS